ncbi:MAG: response regulator [Acidobacteriota bacterium]
MATPRARVLVVDDDPAVVELVAMWLDREHDVVTRTDSREAIPAMRERRPDLVVLDVMMPGMSGLDVAARMRADPDLSEVPILFISAYEAILERHERELVRPWGLLSKPFEGKVLVARVRQILEAGGPRKT